MSEPLAGTAALAARTAPRQDAVVPEVPDWVAAKAEPGTHASATPATSPAAGLAPQADLHRRDKAAAAGLAMPRRAVRGIPGNTGLSRPAPVTDTAAPQEIPAVAPATRRGPAAMLTPSAPATPPPRRAAETAAPTIRIGSLEVRVVPPPTQPPVPQPVRRGAAPPRPPTVSLARGFRSFGLPQA
jgi:hypothetical protein